MNSYQQQLMLDASPAAVFAALTTAEGLRGWWTQDCDVSSNVGDVIRFRCGAHRKEMRIARLDAGRVVAWDCTGAHIDVDRFARKVEWVGTQIFFNLAPHGVGGTCLDFKHTGLVPAFECYGVCSEGWRHYLDSLVQYADTGSGKPYRPAKALAA